MPTSTPNGRRAGAKAQADAESAIATAVAPTPTPDPTPAPTPDVAKPDAPTPDAHAPDTPTDTPDVAALVQAAVAEALAAQAQAQPQPEPPTDAEPPTGRRAQARAQTAQAAKRAQPLVLSHECTWHVESGLGKFGITVEGGESREGAPPSPVREYLTWAPQSGGRVQKIPLYEALFALLDSGQLA
jgi:hypothetical protein